MVFAFDCFVFLAGLLGITDHLFYDVYFVYYVYFFLSVPGRHILVCGMSLLEA